MDGFKIVTWELLSQKIFRIYDLLMHETYRLQAQHLLELEFLGFLHKKF